MPTSGRWRRRLRETQIYISGVYHKAFVDVSEAGVEAAAATAVVAVGGGPRPNSPFLFRTDHPFLFAIRMEPSNAILFLGRMVEPEPPAVIIAENTRGRGARGERGPVRGERGERGQRGVRGRGLQAHLSLSHQRMGERRQQPHWNRLTMKQDSEFCEFSDSHRTLDGSLPVLSRLLRRSSPRIV